MVLRNNFTFKLSTQGQDKLKVVSKALKSLPIMLSISSMLIAFPVGKLPLSVGMAAHLERLVLNLSTVPNDKRMQ